MKRLVAVIIGVAAVTAACTARRMPGPNEPGVEAVVEYAKAEATQCLVPRLLSGRAADAHFVDAEYVWLRKNYPGFRLIEQSLVLGDGDNPGERDELEVMTADGERLSLCFLLFLPDGEAK